MAPDHVPTTSTSTSNQPGLLIETKGLEIPKLGLQAGKFKLSATERVALELARIAGAVLALYLLLFYLT